MTFFQKSKNVNIIHIICKITASGIFVIHFHWSMTFNEIFCLTCTQYCRIIIVFHSILKIFNLKNSILMMIWHFFFVWFNSWKIIMLLMMNAISQKNFSKTFLAYNDWKKNNHYLHTPKYYSQKYWFFLKGKSETQREKQNDFGYEWDDDDCEKEKNIDHNKIIK